MVMVWCYSETVWQCETIEGHEASPKHESSAVEQRLSNVMFNWSHGHWAISFTAGHGIERSVTRQWCACAAGDIPTWGWWGWSPRDDIFQALEATGSTLLRVFPIGGLFLGGNIYLFRFEHVFLISGSLFLCFSAFLLFPLFLFLILQVLKKHHINTP